MIGTFVKVTESFNFAWARDVERLALRVGDVGIVIAEYRLKDGRVRYDVAFEGMIAHSVSTDEFEVIN